MIKMSNWIVCVCVVFLAVIEICYTQDCTYKGTKQVNPDAGCKYVFIKTNSMDQDILASNLTHMSLTHTMEFKNTGITSLPDITALATTLRMLILDSNWLLSALPALIMSQLHNLEELYVLKSPELSQLPDVSMPKLWNLEIEHLGFESIPYLPNLGKTITVSILLHNTNTNCYSVQHHGTGKVIHGALCTQRPL